MTLTMVLAYIQGHKLMIGVGLLVLGLFGAKWIERRSSTGFWLIITALLFVAGVVMAFSSVADKVLQ